MPLESAYRWPGVASIGPRRLRPGRLHAGVAQQLEPLAGAPGRSLEAVDDLRELGAQPAEVDRRVKGQQALLLALVD